VIVGVIDTGVDSTHPLLKDVLLPGKNFVVSEGDSNDGVGHGTHVAGIVHSICPKCSILPVKVLDYYGGDDYTIARGILYAGQQGAKVIQISLGGPAPSGTMCRAIKSVTSAGAQVVIAAGNSASADDWAIGYPGLCDPDSLLVSATNRYNVPSWFSNFGSAVDIAAPGEQVWSTVPTFLDPSGLYPASGTSMAAPMVSGAAALLWAANPGWTAAQIRDRLTSTARDISTLPGVDDVYGARLDVAQAFGLTARPLVVGVEVDKPWLPQVGTAGERTIRISALVRGSAVSTARVAVAIGNAPADRRPMVKGSGDVYSLDYVVPGNGALQRDIIVTIEGTNGAGATAGLPEVVVQAGKTLAPPQIKMLTSTPYRLMPVWFTVEWEGVWNTYDFNCGNGFGTQFYIPKGAQIMCLYDTVGTYNASAALWQDYTQKVSTTMAIEVQAQPVIFLPVISKGSKP
jgi:subtilisin family serine protease